MRHSNFISYSAALALVLPLSACDHKDLCFDHPEHALRYDTDVTIDYDRVWELPYDNLTDWASGWDEHLFGMTYNSLKPSDPEGVRVAMYAKEPPRLVDNIAPKGGVIRMRPGLNSLIFYNNDTEYIVFDDMDNFASAKATTRARSRSTYRGNPFASDYGSRAETTVAPPDVLFAHYIDEYEQRKVSEPQKLSVMMRPLVFTYLVRYEFESGIDYIGIARGALAGMAQSVSLSTGHTSKESASILFDCEVKPWGVEALVRSFGVPDFPNDSYSRAPGEYGLNLEVRLRNGKMFNFDFDVTEQMAKQPHGGVITVGGLRISDEDGWEGGEGFDITVEGWGEWNDIDINL